MSKHLEEVRCRMTARMYSLGGYNRSSHGLCSSAMYGSAFACRIQELRTSPRLRIKLLLLANNVEHLASLACQCTVPQVEQ